MIRDVPSATLRTNAMGEIVLGDLNDITSFRVDVPGIASRTFTLPTEYASVPETFNTTVAKTPQVQIPVTIPEHWNGGTLSRRFASLYGTGANINDYFANLSTDGVFLYVKDLPVGQYSLLVRYPRPQEVIINVVDDAGKQEVGKLVRRILGHNLVMELPPFNASPLQLTNDIAGDELIVRVHGAPARNVRVHVSVSQFVPGPDSLGASLVFDLPSPSWSSYASLLSKYLNGRELGDEYRYILDRKGLAEYPGNSLPRPSLLLNPWAIGT